MTLVNDPMDEVRLPPVSLMTTVEGVAATAVLATVMTLDWLTARFEKFPVDPLKFVEAVRVVNLPTEDETFENVAVEPLTESPDRLPKEPVDPVAVPVIDSVPDTDMPFRTVTDLSKKLSEDIDRAAPVSAAAIVTVPEILVEPATVSIALGLAVPMLTLPTL